MVHGYPDYGLKTGVISKRGTWLENTRIVVDTNTSDLETTDWTWLQINVYVSGMKSGGETNIDVQIKDTLSGIYVTQEGFPTITANGLYIMILNAYGDYYRCVLKPPGDGSAAWFSIKYILKKRG